MKKILLLSCLLMSANLLSAQADQRKLPSFGIHVIANDFATAAELRASTLSHVIRDNKFTNIKRMNLGMGLSYMQGISDHIDFNVGLSGSFVSYDVPSRVRIDKNEQLLLEGTASAHLKLLRDKYLINPYISAGIGANSYRGSFGAFIPAGVGLQIRIVSDVFAMMNAQYRIPVTENGQYHLWYSLGIVSPLKDRRRVDPPPPPPPVVLDRDNDGIADVDDRCPDEAGTAALNGCPDRDGDGLADAQDKCPDEPGTAKYQGCPIPDTDGDGINDEADQCPAEKGVARYQGCPVPDTDKDGINDEEDKCPSRPGPASNMGCPEISREVIERINVAAKNIFFATGSSKLLPKSFKSLDEVVSLLKEDETLMISIDGHTDTTGSREKNMKLSDDRAASVKAYLSSKGIAESRMTSTGYGPDRPVAPNKTAAGRAKNRRVEMTVKNY